ncbi:MAG: VacJ family lipoprotein [Planctomycetes bacterium]|nr:VacJ family lipoprotein [Planctomycetota bacterium]
MTTNVCEIRKRSIRLIPWAGVALIAACAPATLTHDWSAYRGPGAEYFQKTEVEAPVFSDPVEGWNRGMTAANNAVTNNVLEPLSQGYRYLVPGKAREAIARFGQNLLYPRRALANLFRARFHDAWVETKRFAVNTTVGILGFRDPATQKGLPSTNQDFGLTFAAWGWKPSNHLVVPLLGPSTGRDAVAIVPEMLTDPAYYFFPLDPYLWFNAHSDQLSNYRRFVHGSFDPYDDFRLVWTLDRDLQVTPEKFERSTDDTGATQTLDEIKFTCKDPEFPNSMRKRWARVSSTGRNLPYNCRMQPGKAPIVFILPGFAAHRESRLVMALAELAYRNGYSVVALSSAYHEEFMERASSVALPGYTPVDAHDVHLALDAIDRELNQSYPDRIGQKALMGYSMGAFHSIFIAAAERENEGKLVTFDRYVALNPPVTLLHGVEALDRYYNAPLQFPEDQRRAMVERIMRKAVDSFRDVQDGGAETRLSDLEARFVIGMYYRLTLRDIIYASQQRQDLGILETRQDWFHRNAAYREILQYSFMEYFYGFVLPYYAKRDATEVAETILSRNDLRSLGDSLPGGRKIRVLTSENDFLLTPDDISWLVQTLGKDNVTLYSSGGHFGVMTKPEVQKDVIESLAGLGASATSSER